jgi:hypothetical protein
VTGSVDAMRNFAYATAAWLVAFVGWHAPMLFGWNPLPEDAGAAGPDPNPVVFHTYNATLICMAAIGTVVVLATVRPWGRRFPRWLLLTPLVLGSVLLTLRGVPGFVEFVLQITGVAPAGILGLFDPAVELPSDRVRWAGYAINLFFFLGAVLLVPATWHFRRASRRLWAVSRRPVSPDRGNAMAVGSSDRSLSEG